ncbi:MAG: DNA polymerase III subunit beta, partial [Proteobacteria bacterium]
MEIILAKKDLLRLVARMQGVAERKSTMPILASVQLSTQGDDTVRLAATDMYLSLSGVVAAQVKRPGSVAVPAKDLFERIKMMPDGPLSLSSTDGAQTVIKAVGSARRYTLRGSPGTDFPQLPQPAESAAKVEIAIDVLRELIAKT